LFEFELSLEMSRSKRKNVAFCVTSVLV